MSRVLLDTSIIVAVLRDRTRENAERLLAEIGDQEIVLTRIVSAELLCGAKSDAEWGILQKYTRSKALLDENAELWNDAARLYFDARRAGKTIRKLTDCCIAHLAIANNVTLIHNDRDFEAIATVRSLKEVRLDMAKVKK